LIVSRRQHRLGGTRRCSPGRAKRGESHHSDVERVAQCELVFLGQVRMAFYLVH
jgi:hypothetical protein